MCLFKAPQTTAMSTPPPITPRKDTTTALPTPKKVVDTDAKPDVQYGTGQKKAGPAAGKKQGTDALKINLNVGQGSGSETGGQNV
tara:strand:- start:263 stop:517 length:255 start_codon:yes stop_codon:yes gene_type:complete